MTGTKQTRTSCCCLHVVVFSSVIQRQNLSWDRLNTHRHGENQAVCEEKEVWLQPGPEEAEEEVHQEEQPEDREVC